MLNQTSIQRRSLAELSGYSSIAGMHKESDRGKTCSKFLRLIEITTIFRAYFVGTFTCFQTQVLTIREKIIFQLNWSAVRLVQTPCQTTLIKRSGFFHNVKGFDDVSHLDILEVFQAYAALKVGQHLAGVVLEALQRSNAARVNNHAVA